MSDIIKNGKAYDSGDAQIVLDGDLYDEITEISYSTEQEHQLNYGLGNDPKSWSMGKKTPKCSMTLMMTDSVRLERKWGGSLLNGKPFDVNVSFVNEFNDIVNDTVTVKFQNEGREVNGEMGLKRQYEMFCLGVNLNT